MFAGTSAEVSGFDTLESSQSTPAWPTRVVPPNDAPNILLILTDDVGFGAPSIFGGVFRTPTLGRDATNGLRYTNFPLFSWALIATVSRC